MRGLELRVPPPIVLLVALGAMWLIDRALPQLRIPFPGHVALAAVLAVLGILVGVSGVREFRRARTTVNPLKPAEAAVLVSRGIYARTRNPMYLGLSIILVAWGIALANPAPLLLILPLSVAYLTRFQIRPEERVLEEKFGDEFRAYARKVRRWL